MSRAGFRPKLFAFLAAVLLVVTVGVLSRSRSRDGAVSPPLDPGVWVEATLGRMSLEEKVGQLFVTYVHGRRADTTVPAEVTRNRELYGVANARELIEKYHVGGIIYFHWAGNVDNPRQTAELSNDLQRAALNSEPPVPLLVSTDQESGLVARVGEPVTQLPGNMALGATRSVTDACTAARITGEELRALGINHNYAPVADVNSDPRQAVLGVRSYGADPALVAELGAAQVRCYQQAGVAASVKHFPGHGDTSTDSHTGLPVIDHTFEQWEKLDAPPFAAAVRAGAASVLVGHIAVPSLDPSGDPATLSRPIITGQLRERLGFDGVVITDALDMDAVRDRYPDDRVPVLALLAGADQLLMPPDGRFDTQYQAVLAAVRGGELSEERVDDSVRRVLRLKARLGLPGDPFVDVERASHRVGTPANRAAARALTNRSVTLLCDDTGLLPLRDGWRVLVAGIDETPTETLAVALARRGVTITARPGADGETTVATARSHDVTVLTARQNEPRQRQLIDAVAASGGPVVIVALDDPQGVADLPPSASMVLSYGSTAVSLESTAAVLTGEVTPTGRLPVSVVDTAGATRYPIGTGLGYP